MAIGAPLTLSPPGVAKPQLAQTSGASDDVALLGMAHQLVLQRPQVLVAKVLRTMPLEGR